eukprot:9479791-Pyramimonas_sp.AAC.2
MVLVTQHATASDVPEAQVWPPFRGPSRGGGGGATGRGRGRGRGAQGKGRGLPPPDAPDHPGDDHGGRGRGQGPCPVLPVADGDNDSFDEGVGADVGADFPEEGPDVDGLGGDSDDDSLDEGAIAADPGSLGMATRGGEEAEEKI